MGSVAAKKSLSAEQTFPDLMHEYMAQMKRMLASMMKILM